MLLARAFFSGFGVEGWRVEEVLQREASCAIGLGSVCVGGGGSGEEDEVRRSARILPKAEGREVMDGNEFKV